MRKSFVLFALGMCLTLGGCAGEPKVPTVNPAVDCEIEAEMSGTAYDCRVTYVNDQTAAVTFLSPESLKGIRVSRANGECSLSLGTLLCRSDGGLAGKNALPRQLFALLDGVKNTTLTPTENNEEGCTFTGSLEGQEFTLTTDPGGKPTALKSGALSVRFLE